MLKYKYEFDGKFYEVESRTFLNNKSLESYLKGKSSEGCKLISYGILSTNTLGNLSVIITWENSEHA